jgi:hypothetical protein
MLGGQKDPRLTGADVIYMIIVTISGIERLVINVSKTMRGPFVGRLCPLLHQRSSTFCVLLLALGLRGLGSISRRDNKTPNRQESGSCCVNRMTAAADWRVRHVGDNCHHEAEDSGAAEAENTMRRCGSQTQGVGEYGLLRSCWGFHLKETYQSFHVGLVQRFDIPGRIKTRADYV